MLQKNRIAKNKLIKYGLIAIALIAIGAGVKKNYFPAHKAPVYLTAAAAIGDIQDTVLASGTVKAYKQVSVGAQASGQIKALRVNLGDQVREGQLIAEIDSLTQQNVLRSAEADLAVYRAQLRAKEATTRQAELAFKRQQIMYEQDASPRADFELAEATLNSGRADIAALKAQIDKTAIAGDTAKLTLGYTKILAPISGVVVAVVAQQGQTVNANQSTPTIIKLARMDKVTIKTQISEADVTRVKAGQKVFFTILGEPDRHYNTTLRAIEPAPDSILQDDTAASSASSTSASAIYYNGLLDMPNEDAKLRISMTAQVNIVLNEAKGAIVIPATALNGGADKNGLYTVRVVGEDGIAQPRKIKVGINTNAKVQVLQGLVEGEKVVTGEAGAGTGGQQRRPPSIRL